MSSAPAISAGLIAAYDQDGLHRVSSDSDKPKIDEARLVEASQAGDRHSFAQLVELYWDSLYRWMCRLTRDSNIAEDLVQETFLKAFAALNQFRVGSNFRAWVFRIGHNNFVNQRRGQKKQSASLLPEMMEEKCGPVAEIVNKELMGIVWEAIAKLPDDFRSALLLRAEEHLSFKEIAQIMSITEETARWRVYKARQKLVSALNPEVMSEISQEPKS